jgi:archaellum biogenesis ATPase FlaH
MAAKEALNLMRDLRHNIQHFLNEANFAAESAADDLFNDQFSSCALEKIDELNALLKQCREKFNSVRNIIIDSLEPVRLLSEQEIEVCLF